MPMRTDDRYASLISMVRAVLETVEQAIAADEQSAVDMARLAHDVAGQPGGAAEAFAQASRHHAVRALAARGPRAALLAQYGLATPDGDDTDR
jgi:HPt (histidine-containing phosphotransfer) domain-containing protein